MHLYEDLRALFKKHGYYMEYFEIEHEMAFGYDGYAYTGRHFINLRIIDDEK